MPSTSHPWPCIARTDDRADYGVEAGAIPAAGQHANLFCRTHHRLHIMLKWSRGTVGGVRAFAALAGATRLPAKRRKVGSEARDSSETRDSLVRPTRFCPRLLPGDRGQTTRVGAAASTPHPNPRARNGERGCVVNRHRPHDGSKRLIIRFRGRLTRDPEDARAVVAGSRGRIGQGQSLRENKRKCAFMRL